jgi:hypothetical protein
VLRKRLLPTLVVVVVVNATWLLRPERRPEDLL